MLPICSAHVVSVSMPSLAAVLLLSLSKSGSSSGLSPTLPSSSHLMLLDASASTASSSMAAVDDDLGQHSKVAQACHCLFAINVVSYIDAQNMSKSH
jgi:hypothetical protein